ncbi:MAG TPA: DNA repair protein RecO [Firmicutes bacterium]|nr:DNA repair protein RecO [Bacillota bacterium]
MAVSSNVLGIVLKTYDLGEKDKILVLLTREQGKLRVVAKGARRPGGRFAALEPLVEVQAAIYPGKSLYTLTQSALVTSHRLVREQLDRLAYGLFMAELLDLFTVDAEARPTSYDLLSQALTHLEEDQPETVLAYFETHLLRQMGLLPAWQACISCQTTESRLVALNLPEGGLVCAACAQKLGGVPLTEETILLLQFFAQVGWEGYGTVDAGALAPKLAKALEQFIFYQLSGRPRSYDFLNSLRHL